MRMRSIASRALLPGLILCTCFAAQAAQKTANKPAPEVRLTPFVLGAASSKVKPHAMPKTEAQAAITKRYTANGIMSMELPEESMMNVVRVVDADGKARMIEQMGDAPVPAAAKLEASE